MWDKNRTAIPWAGLNTLFELENLDADQNSYGAPITMALAATRPIGHPDEIQSCSRYISELSGFVAKVVYEASARHIELNDDDLTAISEIQEIIRVLALRIEQWGWIHLDAEIRDMRAEELEPERIIVTPDPKDYVAPHPEGDKE